MLEIKDLTCGYDKRFHLRGINLVIEEGGFFGIIGPNGSGKTTLLRAITRVLEPESGEVFLRGKNIRQIDFRELARTIAVVSQNVSTDELNVREFVLLSRIPHYKGLQFLETKHDEEIADSAMALTGTLKFKDRLMSEISGGERQLVLIARALAQEPKFLLLDEPTSHLDITHQVRILDLLKKLNKELSLTVIIVLHDLNLASEYCDRIALLSGGAVYKEGLPQDVLDYKTIENVYKTVVVVEKNPVSSKPYVLLVSEEEREKRRKKQ
ncbi:MAG: ABC transporter ATP-binding protein [Candidatus Omnitrophica bacterium]|nr:ABC transporter ATP-binding protein [Candidatus Omnitrophota bacterium]